jgi:hypothetical protein
MHDDRPRQRHALLLAAGQAFSAGDPGTPRYGRSSGCHRPGIHIGLGHLAELQAVLDVLPHRQVREDRVILEHHADVALVRRDGVDDLVVEADRPASMLLNPAIMRSSVVLPQPDGPSSVKNSPFRISTERSGMIVTGPYCLTTFST